MTKVTTKRPLFGLMPQQAAMDTGGRSWRGHILSHKHQSEKANWKQDKAMSSEGLSSVCTPILARLHHLNLPNQRHQISDPLKGISHSDL